MERRARLGRLLCWSLVIFHTSLVAAEQEPFDVSKILEGSPGTQLELVQTRLTAYEQMGHGFQSQAGPIDGPGSERLTVFQTQAEFVAQKNDATHRLWVPVDIVSSASSDASDRHYAAPDVISSASAYTFGAEAEYELAVVGKSGATWAGGAAYHQEETLHSWRLSLGYERPFAEDNATFSLNANQVLDWFNRFELGGQRVGRASQASSNFNVGVSQLLSSTTVLGVGYGLTLQSGELSNTVNSVPTTEGGRVLEVLPESRLRHAGSVTLSQWLPWQGALHTNYRFYADDWGVVAHTAQARMLQRVLPWLVVGVKYRIHDQSKVRFFQKRADPGAAPVTADSDLAEFVAQTVGGQVTVDLPTRHLGVLFLSAGYEHYFRSNDLRVNVATWASGLRL